MNQSLTLPTDLASLDSLKTVAPGAYHFVVQANEMWHAEILSTEAYEAIVKDVRFHYDLD